jgi:hypothetical protein
MLSLINQKILDLYTKENRSFHSVMGGEEEIPEDEEGDAEDEVVTCEPEGDIAAVDTPQSIIDLLEGIRKQVRVTSVPVIEYRTDGEELVLCLSDIHYGARVKDGMTGATIYDPSITEAMIESIPHKVLASAKEREFTGITIVLAGDVVDGEEIYPTHGHHLDICVVDQTRGLVKSLWKMLKVFGAMFEHVRVIGVRGNHGRMSKMADERSNWDNVVYQQLALLIEMEDSNLAMEVAYGEYYNFDILGWVGHVRHEAVPHDGTAAMRNKLGSWAQMHQFSFLICGHHHHAGILNYNGMCVFRNGGMMVGSDYAERLARQDPPRQILFGLTKDTLPTFVSFLDWPL